MKIGIIDLGANSLRFDIYNIMSSHSGFSGGSKASLLYRHRDMIRIGDHVFTQKRFSKSAIQRLLKALAQVTQIAQKNAADKMICVGTSPFREAKDAFSILKKIKEKTGLTLSILSGKKEARLIAKAILHFHPLIKPTVLIDIGGGSTEITIFKNKKILFSKSFSLGSMRLQRMYLKKVPPSPKAILHLKAVIQSLLKKYIPSKYTHVPHAIGGGGTLKALLKTTHSQNNILSKSTLEIFASRIAHLTLPKLKHLLKTEGQRGDIILAGTLLLLEILSFFHLNSIYVSQRGLKDGILLDQIRQYDSKKKKT